MNERVSEYATVCLSGITLKVRFNKAVEKLSNSIKVLETLKEESAISADSLDKEIDERRNEIEKLTNDHKEAMKKKARFVYTAEDYDLFDAFKAGEDLAEAFVTWADAWSLDLRNTGLLKDLVNGVSGKQGKASARTIINTEFGTMTKDRNMRNFLDIAYGIMCEECVKKGLKMDIPDDVRAAYAPKKKADK